MAGQSQEAEVNKPPVQGQENAHQGAERQEDVAEKQRDGASTNGAHEAFDQMKADSSEKKGQDHGASDQVAVAAGLPSADSLLNTGDVSTEKKADGPEAGGDQPGMVEDGSRTVFGRMGDWAAGAVSTLKDSASSALDSLSEGWDDFYDTAGDWLGIGGDPDQDIQSASDLAAVSNDAGQELLDANKDKVQQFHGKAGKEFVEGKIGDMTIPGTSSSERGKFGQVMDALGTGLKGDNVVTRTGPNGDKIQTDPDTGFERIESADGRSVVLRMSDGSVVTRQRDESGAISSEQWRFKNDDGTYSVLNHEGRGRWSGVVDGVTVASDNGARVEQDTGNNFDITKHGLSEGVGETEDKWYTSDGDGHVMTIDKQSGQAELYVDGQRYRFDENGGLVDENGKPANLGLLTDSQTGDSTIGGLTIGNDHRRAWAHGHHGGKHRISADANEDGSHIVSEGVAPDAYTGPDAEPDDEKYARDNDRNNIPHALRDVRGNEGQPGIANSDGYTITQDPDTGNVVWKDRDGKTIADFNTDSGKGQNDGFHFDGDDVTMDINGLKINGAGDIFNFDGDAIFTSSDSLWYGSGWGTDSYDYYYTGGMSTEQAQSTVQGEVNEARTVAMPAFLAALASGQTGGDMTNMKGMISAGIGQIDQAKALCLSLGAVDQIGVLDSMLSTGLAANSQSDRQATMESTMGLYMEGGGVGQGMMLNGLRAKLATGGTFTISVVDEMKNWDSNHGNAEMIV